MAQILFVTAAIFLLPSLVLGMISPVVVKLCVADLAKTGATVGKIYAFSTLGSILGTFLTGFLLIEWLGTRTVLYSVAAILILLAPVFGRLFWENIASRRMLVGLCSVVLIGVLVGCSLNRQTLAEPIGLDKDKHTYRNGEWHQHTFFKESDYYTIKLHKEGKRDDDTGEIVPLTTLVLDHLVHSYTHMEKPSYLKYDYLRIYDDLVSWQRSRRAAHRYLFIGGGGYTLPRHFDKDDSKAEIDVVEIDPWVSKVAKEHLGIDGTRIRTINQDGRWFAMNCKEKYDFIFGDAFNDLSIPYHLTTLEFDLQLKNLLTPDGLLMALVIDSIKDGEFLPSYIKTLQAAFGEENVDLITIYNRDLDRIPTETCIVVASQTKLDFEDFDRFLKDRGEKLERETGVKYRRVSHVVPHKRLDEYLKDIKRRGRRPMVLTDDFVPADNLIAKLFYERFTFKKERYEYDD
jgi:spermidine synthase